MSQDSRAFDPLRHAPDKAKRRYAKLAERAATQPRAATKLGCLSCYGWDYGEAKACEIATCPHWAISARIFGR